MAQKLKKKNDNQRNILQWFVNLSLIHHSIYGAHRVSLVRITVTEQKNSQVVQGPTYKLEAARNSDETNAGTKQ